MKGIRENPALDAYQRMAVSPVSAARPPVREEGGVEAGSTPVAHVSISSRARDLAAGAGPELDVQKVEALKAKIADQSFQMDAEQIAKRLLDIVG